MTEITPAHEHLEHAEHAEHAAHEGGLHAAIVPLSIAVMAVAAGVLGILEGTASASAIIALSDAAIRRNEATDICALGITMFRALTGEYPYGNLDAVSPARRKRPTPLATLRPDLPAWLQNALARAIALDPAERFQDVMEFAFEMETGPARPAVEPRRPQTLYERNPLRFWQGVSALLALALRHGRLDADQVWAAAHVDEDWNSEKWGIDEEVAARRADRLGAR